MPPTAVDRRPAVAPDRDLTNPLDRLKRMIRVFVGVDVALFVALFLSAWFWVGVGVDYGLFKGFGLDVAQQLTPAIRIGTTLVLAVTLVALAVWRVLVLVNKRFSLPALALVLEKRYPKVLGDRLITAIQMADVERAAEAGYSADLVRHTIAEARERMKQVNVAAVFNWGRLWLKGGLIAGVWAVAVLVALGLAVFAAGGDFPRGAKKAADVCGIFTERNALFLPTPWPRRAHLEVVDFDDDGHPNELRVGKGSPTPPKVTARAVRWVVADDAWKNPDGWRAMTVADLKAFGIKEARPELVVNPAFVWAQPMPGGAHTVGEKVLAKETDLPAASAKLEAAWADWRKRYDDIEKQAAGTDTKADEGRLTAALEGVKGLLDKLAAEDGTAAAKARLADLEAKGAGKPAGERVAALQKYAEGERQRLDAQLAALADARVLLSPDRRVDDVEKDWENKKSGIAARVEELRKAPDTDNGAEHQLRDLEKATTFTADVLDPLAAAADDLNNTRKLRRLDLPGQLKMRVDGLQTRSRNFLDLVPDATGRYAAEVANLSESVRFTVSAEDYVSARRQITLVPPPTLVDLYRDEYQPAYMHHAAPIPADMTSGDTLFALRGRAHKLPTKKISITSDKSVFSAPVGTELTITAEADKDLKVIEIRPVGANPLAVPEFARAEAKEETRDERGVITADRFVDMAITRPAADKVADTRLELARDPQAGKKADAAPDKAVPLAVTPAEFDGKKLGVRRFTLKFDGKRAIRQLDKPTEFQIAMTDTDNVTSVRTIAITAQDDSPPQVEVLVDPVIRKVGGQFMVTPVARVPFLPDSKIWDDHGLSSVRFEFKKTAEEAQSLVALRAMAAVAVSANSLAPTPSWAMPATVLHSQTQFDLIFGSTIPQVDSSGNVRLPGIDVERFDRDKQALQRLTLPQLDEATVPREGGEWAEALLAAELARQQIKLDGMKPADLAAKRAELLARLKAGKAADTRDRGPQTVKAVKLSDAVADAFDLRKFMPELLETRPDAVQQRYKVELFVAAKDVNVELTGKDGKPAEPKAARNLDPIRLTVVSEADLLVEIGKDEEMQGQRMDDSMSKATGGRSKLDREFSLIRTLPGLAAKEKTDQLLSSQVRLTDIGQDLGKVRELLTAMKTEYEKLYREMDVNRFSAPNMRKYKNEAGTAEELQTGYLDLLAQIIDEGRALSKAEKSVEAVRGTLAASQTPTDAALTEANNDYATLMRLLGRLAEQIIIRNDINKERDRLRKIIADQENLGVAIEAEKANLEGELKRPTLLLPKDVTKVAAGKTVKIKLGVRWKLYPETSLFVGVDVPGSTELTLPKELIVKAKGDEDVTEVEVTVTAGAKTGVHTVTLRPGPFRPVELQIEVTK
jgi:hypothetical protein